MILADDACHGLARRLAAGFATPSVAHGKAAEVQFYLYDRRADAASAVRQQDHAKAAGITLIPVAVTAGSIRIGPLLPADGPAAICPACVEARLTLNSGRPDHAPAARATEPGGPLPAPAFDALVALLHHAVSAGSSDTLLRIATDTLTVSRHRILPLSDCHRCSPPAATGAPAALSLTPRPRPPGARRAANPRLSLTALRDAFVDPMSGIVHHVFANLGSDMMPLAAAEMRLPGSAGVEMGYGRAGTRAASELVAILEAIERHVGQRPRGAQRIERGSHAAMRAAHGNHVVDPRRFILHDPARESEPGFRLQRWNADLPFDWVWGHALPDGAPRLVPAQLVFYGLTDQPGRPLNRFVFDSSNGCALGGSLEEAAVSGLYEVIERDAYLATWYSRLPPVGIDPASVDEPGSAALIARARAAGFDIRLFDLSGDIAVPVVLGMIVDPREDAPVKSYCASASHHSIDEALFGALVEITTSMGVYRRSMPASRARARQLFADPSAVQRMEDHVLLHSLPESIDRLAFLHGGGMQTLAERRGARPALACDDSTAELRALLSRVSIAADEAILVDLGFPALEPLGLAAAKLVVPGLLPVTFGHQHRRISYPRLDRWAAARGRPDLRFGPDNVNPWPHNFP